MPQPLDKSISRMTITLSSACSSSSFFTIMLSEHQQAISHVNCPDQFNFYNILATFIDIVLASWIKPYPMVFISCQCHNKNKDYPLWHSHAH
jgi:hypothetical protein